MSNAACLIVIIIRNKLMIMIIMIIIIRPRLFYALFRRVKDHHKLLNYSPRLKKPCLRQVVLDK